MKLNFKGKKELREKIQSELYNAQLKPGERIHLDKELLESLIFDEVSVKNGCYKVKAPVWTGSFLKKLDLSELSFDNVYWNINNLILKNLYGFDQYFVDFSNTNVNIDFSKSGTKEDSIIVSNCDFSGVDLSNSHVDIVFKFLNVNLQNTKFPFSDFKFVKNACNSKYTYFDNVDFKGNDFKNTEMDVTTFINHFSKCNFSNTNLTLCYNKKEDISGIYGEKLAESIKGKRLVGCKVNGKVIKSYSEKESSAKEQLEKYNQFKEDTIDAIVTDINKQVKKFEKKRK